MGLVFPRVCMTLQGVGTSFRSLIQESHGSVGIPSQGLFGKSGLQAGEVFSPLAKKLGVDRDDLEALSELLRQLIADGSARVSDSGRIESSRRSAGITGIVKRTASGDGYVTVNAASSPKIVGEVVVFSEDMRDAQDRDEVLIRLTGKRRGDQRIAVVEKVVKRATTTFVGTYLESHSGGWVKIDGKQFPEPIALDDPEAGGVRHGDKVVVEMLRFPTPRRPGEASSSSGWGLRMMWESTQLRSFMSSLWRPTSPKRCWPGSRDRRCLRRLGSQRTRRSDRRDDHHDRPG